MRISTTLGSAAVAGALVAGVVVVPADAAPTAASAASARHSLVRTCTFDGPKHTPLRIKLRLPLRAKGDNDLRAVKVRATDNRRVNVGQVVISVENENQSSGNGSIGSASAVRRHGSPATWRLNPRTNGSEVERVVAEVTFKLRHGPRVVATCAARP